MVICGITNGYKQFNVELEDGRRKEKGDYYSCKFRHVKSNITAQVVSMHLPSDGNIKAIIDDESESKVYVEANKVLNRIKDQGQADVFICSMDANTKTHFEQRFGTIFGGEFLTDDQQLKGPFSQRITFFTTQGPTVNKERGFLQFQTGKAEQKDTACKDIIGFHGSRAAGVSCCRWAGKALPPDGELASLPSANHYADHAWLIATIQVAAVKTMKIPKEKKKVPITALRPGDRKFTFMYE